MANLLSNLEIGLSALKAQRMNIQIAGGNIANVETDGYSRRKVDLRADSVQSREIGIGVSVEDIQRLQSPFLSKLLRQELGTLGQFEEYSNGLENLESIFYVSNGDSNSTLGDAMEKFWNSFGELANNPESLETRNIVRNKGEFLATTINDFFSQLKDFQKKIGETIKKQIEKINGFAGEIGKLNAKIGIAKAAGDETSGLQDKREHLIDQLARLIDTRISETQNGMVSINVGHKPLVHSDSHNELKVDHESSDDTGIQTLIKLKSGESLTIESGELRALMDVSDSVIPAYLHDLDQIAANIIKEVNNLHKEGIGLDGSTGNNFFAPELSDDSPIEGMAGRMEVSEAIIEDPKKIAASKTGAVGDSQTAMAITQLRDKYTMESSTVTFDEYYQGVISQIGMQTQTAEENLDIQEQVIGQLEQRKEAVSGVSLDEEAVNLVRFQRAYQAAAKYMNVIDEMLNTIINQV